MTGSTEGPDGGAPRALAAWLDSLGPLAAERPTPSILHSAAGVGGGLVAAGAVTLGGQRWASSGSSSVAVLLAAAVLAAGVAATVRLSSPFRVAGVGASGVAAPALAFFVFAGDGFPRLRSVAVLAAVLLAALYGAGPWRGHTFHLSILAAAGWVFAVSFADLGVERSFFGGFGTVGDAVSAAGGASMVVGVVYLGVGSWLHDEGLEGMATPFLGVAALALPAGALALAQELGSGMEGLVGLAAGAFLALVGARCRRRGTTWAGLAVAVIGMLAVADAVSDRTAVVALVIVVAGAALVFVAPMVAALVGEPPPIGEEPDP